MVCQLVTNRANSLAEILRRGGIGEHYDVKNPEVIEKYNKELLDKHRTRLGVPRNITPISIQGDIVVPNEEFFQRLDASMGILYPENFAYISDYEYPIDAHPEVNQEELASKLEELLRNIGVTVTNTLNQRADTVSGKANVLHKAVYATFDSQNLGSLPEEAAHMFVAFIKEHEPTLYNRMMADIPRLDLYTSVKEEYMPLYGDINLVKEEAIGKAIAHYLVQKNPLPINNKVNIESWFDKVLAAFRKFLQTLGIQDIKDYNSIFEITADRVLGGEFQGEFRGEDRTFLQTTNNSGPLGLLDSRNALLELRSDGHYYYNGKKIPMRVTQKVKNALRKNAVPDDSPLGLARRDWGTKGHQDLMHLFNKAIAEREGRNYDFTPESSSTILNKLQIFVNSIMEQFPDAEFRTEVKITDGSRLAGTVDLLIIDKDGFVNIFDYKFSGREPYLSQEWEKQLSEYRRILKDSYKFTKFGQIRIIPIRTEFKDTNTANPTIADIEIGTNRLQPPEKEHLNPLPASFERTPDPTVNRLLDFLQEEIVRATNTKVETQSDRDLRNARVRELKLNMARLQITQDVTSIVELAVGDLARMKYLLNKGKEITESELLELYTLKNHYIDIIKKGYNINRKGQEVHELTEASAWAQASNQQIEDLLEEYLNSINIDISSPIKPGSKWRRLGRLSDYDIPAFQALQKLLHKGYFEQQAILKKQREEIQDILRQIRVERGSSTTAAFEPILQKGKGRLISPRSQKWYELHKAAMADPAKLVGIRKYFDEKAWEAYSKPLIDEFKASREYLLTPKTGQSQKAAEAAYNAAVNKFKAQLRKTRGEGNPNSKFYKIPDEYLDPNWVKYVRDAPNSGLARLYNKFVEINEYANENSDSNIPRNFLPYVRKRTIEMLTRGELDLAKLKDNALNSLKSYEWETFELDHNGQPIYKIPLKYGTPVNRRNLDDQSYDLGEMLMLWTDAVYQNAYLHKTHSTAKIYQMALEKSRQFVIRNGKPVRENGEFRTQPVESETLAQYQEYLNMYYYGVQSEDTGKVDDHIWGLHPRKMIQQAMRLFSGKTLAFDIFNAFANLTGGFSNAIAIGTRGNNFTIKQYKDSFMNLMDPKVQAFRALVDIDANVYDINKTKDLSISQASKLVSWDNLFVLQRKGDWLLQNLTLGAMAQNFTIDADGNIVKRKKGEKHLLELLDEKDGKMIIKGLDFNKPEDLAKLYEWREKVRSVNAEILGMTPEYDRFLAGNTLVGQLLLQFRRWALPMGTSRYGALRYNAQLEEFSYGRHRSTLKTLLDKRIFKALPKLITLQHSPDFEDILREHYEQALELNPNLEYEQYKQLIVNNMRATVVEVLIVGLIAALMMALDDDDEVTDSTLVERMLVRGFSRTSDELTFWYSPSSFASIVQSPIPLLGLFKDLNNLMFASQDSIAAYLWGDDDDVDIWPRINRLFIGTNAWEKLQRELAK